MCEGCYQREGWAEVDLTGERDMWEIATGTDAGD
jgi:hypothetical protein